ncbi:MAG: exodeoxyribonuclease VII small subunit, partial [Candidatus Uhrbacteria bacterium]|nr:exodeoxyribonuclease VII small subunit [Candidatus Uhrbacteria bacterium]
SETLRRDSYGNSRHHRMKKDQTIQELIQELEKTVAWFQSRENIDIEEGLKRVKDGAELVKILKAKLKKVENEFEEIEKDLDVDNE